MITTKIVDEIIDVIEELEEICKKERKTVSLIEKAYDSLMTEFNKPKIILQKGRYALIDKGHEYVVACGFDETKPINQQWSQGYYYTHWNRNEDMKMVCLQAAIDHFRTLTDEEYISRRRLEELATKFKDGLIEWDECSAMEFFTEECDLSESEMEWLGLEMEG